MFDVRIINDEAILFEDDIEVKNLEYLRDEDGDIKYDFPDGNYVTIDSDNDIEWCDSDDREHRDGDMPSTIRAGGNITYCKHGKIHRECGPATSTKRQQYWLNHNTYDKNGYIDVLNANYGIIAHV